MLRVRSAPTSNTLAGVNLYESEIEICDRKIQSGHFLSLVSCFVPSFRNEDMGWFEYKLTVEQLPGIAPYKRYDLPILRTLKEWAEYIKFLNLPFNFDINDNMTVIKAPQNAHIQLTFSPRILWLLGINKPNQFTLDPQQILFSSTIPPLSVEMIKVLIDNCTPNAIASKDFSQNTLCVLDSSNNFKFFNPYVIIDHEIVSPTTMHLSFVDQRNRPFVFAPVHIELFLSPTSSHEKKQAFFRVGGDFSLTFPREVSQVSIADAFGGIPLLLINKRTMRASLKITKGPDEAVDEKVFDLLEHHRLLPLKNHVMTRHTWPLVCSILSDEIQKYVSQRFPRDNVELKLQWNILASKKINIKLVTNKSASRNNPDWWEFKLELPLCLMPPNHRIRREIRCILDTHINRGSDRSFAVGHSQPILYSGDDVVSIRCDAIDFENALIVIRNDMGLLTMPNRFFWTWTKVSPPSKILDFTTIRTTIYQDGSEGTVPLDMIQLRDQMGLDGSLIVRVIFK